MNISATIHNSYLHNDVTVSTNHHEKRISIPGKPEGFGSSVNGGELLLLALATCFCNDIYREASRRNMKINSVKVSVSGVFAKEGEAGSDIVYEADVQSDSPQQAIDALIQHVDSIAEIHNTLRQGASVSLKSKL